MYLFTNKKIELTEKNSKYTISNWSGVDSVECRYVSPISGNEIYMPVYDYTVHNRSDVKEIVHPTDVIILEGLFALYNPEIRELEDIKVFVT